MEEISSVIVMMVLQLLAAFYFYNLFFKDGAYVTAEIKYRSGNPGANRKVQTPVVTVMAEKYDDSSIERMTKGLEQNAWFRKCES